MISLKPQNAGAYAVFESGNRIGTVTVSRNPLHKRNAYITLDLQQLDAVNAPELFRVLRERLACPLQVMVDSGEDRLAAFLAFGGFTRRRRCYITEASQTQLKSSSRSSFRLETAASGSLEYNLICEAQYRSYAKTHEAVNPLTAELSDFCRHLPETVLYRTENGRLCHWAFVEDNEIAYVGTTDMGSFICFAETLLTDLFVLHRTVLFEADDCDPAAMALRSFFDLPDTPCCDTYVYP